MKTVVKIFGAVLVAVLCGMAHATQVYEWDAVCTQPTTIGAPQNCVADSSVVIRMYLSDAYVPGTLINVTYMDSLLSPYVMSIDYRDTTITSITQNPDRVSNVPRDMSMFFMLPANDSGVAEFASIDADCCELRINMPGVGARGSTGTFWWGQEGCYGPPGPFPGNHCSTNGYEATGYIVSAGFVPEPPTWALLLVVPLALVTWKRRPL